MKKAQDVLCSIALSVIACGAVAAAAASARAQPISISAGLRGSLTPSLGVAMIYMERSRDSACAQAYAAVPVEFVERGGRELSAPARSAGFTAFDPGAVSDAAHAWSQLIPAAVGRMLQDANLSLPTAADLDAIGDDLQSAYQTLASASCQGAGLQMTPVVLKSIATAPEPATWAMLIAGVAMVGLAARRRLRAPLAD